MNIAVIGYGHMAGAMIRGWIRGKAFRPQEIYVCAHHYDPLKRVGRGTGALPLQEGRGGDQKGRLGFIRGPGQPVGDDSFPPGSGFRGKGPPFDCLRSSF